MSEINHKQLLQDNITEINSWLAHNKMAIKNKKSELKKYSIMLEGLDNLAPVNNMENLTENS